MYLEPNPVRVYTVTGPDVTEGGIPAEIASKLGMSVFPGAVVRDLDSSRGHVEPDRRLGSPPAELTQVLKARRAQIEQIIERAGQLAEGLKKQPRPLVLCHTDVHGWNVLLGADGALYIADWDSPLLAPKERDLMFTRGEVGGVWYRTADEAQFCEGYGQTEIDADALAYYRFERIVEDIAVSCELVFSTEEGSPARLADREQAVRIVGDSFLQIGPLSDRP